MLSKFNTIDSSNGPGFLWRILWQSSRKSFSQIWLHTRYESRKKKRESFYFLGYTLCNLFGPFSFLPVESCIDQNHIFQVEIWRKFASKRNTAATWFWILVEVWQVRTLLWSFFGVWHSPLGQTSVWSCPCNWWGESYRFTYVQSRHPFSVLGKIPVNWMTNLQGIGQDFILLILGSSLLVIL